MVCSALNYIPFVLTIIHVTINLIIIFFPHWLPSFLFFKRSFYLFLEKGEGREKERERNIHVWLPLMRPLLGTWPATQACALTGNRTGDRLVRRPVLHPLSHTSQGWKAHSKGRSSYVEDLLLRYIPPHLLPKQRRRLGKGCFG